MRWTPESVKAALPDVDVLVGRKVYAAKIIGRKMPFATVCVPQDSRLGSINLEFQVAWPTLADVLNRGGAVRL